MPRIILVDDEKIPLREMTDELREQGWSVDSFDNPLNALQALERQDYDLGIFDIKMPQMSGVELLEKAKALQEKMDVVFVTAYPEISTAIDAVQLGAADYLTRPFYLRDLVRVVERIFTNQSLQKKLDTIQKKLDTIAVVASETDVTQTLEDALSDTIEHVASTLSPNFICLVFVDLDDSKPIVKGHGLDAKTEEHLRDRLSDLNTWLESRIDETVPILKISGGKTFPLPLGEIEAILLAPIRYEHHIVGALLCGAPSSEAFSQDDEWFILSIARFLSHFVERAMMINKQREHYRQTINYLRTLAESTAHGIKNPLAVISGRAQKAMKSADEESQVYQDLRIIYDQAMAADDRMNELLDLCHLTDIMSPEPTDLNRLARETFVATRSTGIPDGVELKLELADAPVIVKCDPIQLKRALKNVIDNAIRQTDESGTDRKVITVRISVAYGIAEIRVHNTGETIPQESWEEVFKPAFRRKPKTSHYRQTGDGLTIAQGILRSHGGEVAIEASSEDNDGTTFLLTVPLAEGKEME